MARILTAAEMADKWNRRLAASTPEIRAGIDAVTESPTEKAAVKSRDWQAAMAQDRTRTRFESGLRRVTLADWKRKAIDKGVARIAGGAEAAKPKMEAFAKDFLPFVYGVAEDVRAMPGVTLEDGINRMVTQIRAVAEYKRP